MKNLLIGIDIGTTGSKTVIFDTEGNKLGSSYREYSCDYIKPNWVEQDCNMLVVNSMEATKEVLKTSGINSNTIAAISFSTQRTCTLFLDRNGHLVRPMISWQDSRATEEMEYIDRVLGKGRFESICKLPKGAIWIVNKILWLRNHEPENWSKVRHIVQLQDYFLNAYGAEGYITDQSDAGLYGCRDLYGNCWSDEICSILNIDISMLPKVASSGTIVGAITPSVAKKTGLAIGTPICVGAGDQNAASVGAGVIKKGMISVSLGTAGLAAAFFEGQIETKTQMMLTSHPIAGCYMLEGHQPASASSLRWFRDEITKCWFRKNGTDPVICTCETEKDIYGLLDEIASLAPVGSKGIIVNPYFAGAGTPRWNANARSVITGLTFAHDRACLVRSFMEGITLEVKDMLNSMEKCGAQVNEIRIFGGPTKSNFWNQIQADVYNCPVSTLMVTDAAPLGAAICAGVGVGVFKDIKEGVNQMVHTSMTYEPIQNNVAIYRELYDIFCDIYDALSQKAFDRIAHIQDKIAPRSN